MKRIAQILITITWPIALFVNNTFINFLNYALPIFEPKFAILPLLFILIYFQFKKPVLIILSILILILFFKPFFGQTIFKYDYQAQQQILQKQNLYPAPFLARLFQNKAKIPLDKFTNNFFKITDPNNYFFGYAPGQIIIDNQNLTKFPFLSLPFMLIGLYYIFKKPSKYKLLFSFLFAAIINLSLLANFDRNDFILWIPLLLVVIHGLDIFDKKFKYVNYYGIAVSSAYYIFFILFTSVEIIRIFVK